MATPSKERKNVPPFTSRLVQQLSPPSGPQREMPAPAASSQLAKRTSGPASKAASGSVPTRPVVSTSNERDPSRVALPVVIQKSPVRRNFAPCFRHRVLSYEPTTIVATRPVGAFEN